ncbi:MAG TPA: penicillin-binding protein [Chitinophagaceae bacterium]|nr:penicillin-binding protein [Chitinophagaceae bacterium]
MEVKRDILWRVYLCFLGIVVFSLLVLGRAIYIQQVQGEYWVAVSDSLRQKFVETDAERGTIFSEDGNMLSTSIPYFDIYIDFGADGLREKEGKRFKDNVDSLSIALANYFKDKSSKEYKRALQKGYRERDRYYLLKKNISFEQYKVLRNFPLVKQGRNKSGFIAEVKSKRLNPFGLLANRTIGLARANAQNVGIERTYDSLLKGESGKKLVRFVGAGAYIPVEGYEIEPKNGKDIVTTIDVNIQDIAENALLKMMESNQAAHGTCIVMEVKTGKIKAIANLGRLPDGSYWEDLNYAIRASEPGSTFKLATMIALLEDKYVSLDNHVNLEGGTWKVYRRTVYDSERHGLNEVTIKQAFEHSSNVGMAKLACAYYTKKPEQFIAHLKKLRLDQPSGIDLLGETRPIIKNPASRTWSATTLPWMSFGYEVLVSPLQTLMLYNAVANNGKMMRPYLVKEVHQGGVLIEKKEPQVLEESICSEATLKQLKACLEGVLTDGTGKSLLSTDYSIAGKTGTALVANGSRGYADHIYQSSFAGYFPANDPQYSCIVVIKNKPFARKYYGALVAGPVFREVADKLMALSADKNEMLVAKNPVVKPDSSTYYYAGYTPAVKEVFNTLRYGYYDSAGSHEWSRVYTYNYKPVLGKQAITKQVMPDLTGMGLKDALYLLENMNMKVMVKGKGRVIRQSVEAGLPYSKTQPIVLELN